MTQLSNSDLKAFDRHARGLGTVFTNLLSLEFLLRLFLYDKRSRPHTSFARGQNLTGLCVGEVLPENAVTAYDSLGKLIGRYNAIAARGVASPKLAENLVSLRDALAHGRLFVPKTGLPLQLIKFTMPRDGKVRVDFAAALSPEWLVEQNARVQTEISKVRTAIDTARRRRRAYRRKAE
jgi:hypothetical protein